MRLKRVKYSLVKQESSVVLEQQNIVLTTTCVQAGIASRTVTSDFVFVSLHHHKLHIKLH